MNTPPAASAAGASARDVLVIGGGPAGAAAAALLLFKWLYYATSLLNFRRTLMAWRARKRNIRVVDEIGAAMN